MSLDRAVTERDCVRAGGRKRRLRNPLLLAMIISLASAGWGAAKPSQHPPGDQVHQLLTTLAAKNHVCAAAIAVIKNRKLASTDVVTGCHPVPAMTTSSVFQAASLGKPVFAYAVLKLVEQGRLDLDAPVISYLPQGYRRSPNILETEPSDLVTDPKLQAVTVRMVLNHTSGMPNFKSGPLSFVSEPGTQWTYSGEGFVLLQRAVEAVAGEPLDRFMAAQVFEPLGMDHSDYVWSDRIANSTVPGTKANGGRRQTIELEKPIAAFSLYTTAEDYGKFLAAVLSDKSVLNHITQSPVPVDPRLNIDWGLGWGVERADGDLYIWHWGNNPGYRAFVIASVRTGDGFVILTNSENGLALAEPVTRAILPGDHRLFRFPMLGDDPVVLACKRLRLCL